MSGGRYWIALAAIAAVAVLVRWPLLGTAAGSYRRSEALAMEEVENVRISTGMLHRHTLNPHAFEYPSLFYYLVFHQKLDLTSLKQDRWVD